MTGTSTASTVKTAVLVLYVAIALGAFVFGRGYSVRVPPLMAVPLAAIWVAALAPYSRFKTVSASVIVGVGLLLAESLMLLAIYADEHSTAALGFLGWPVYLVAGLGCALLIEYLVFRWRVRGSGS